MVVQYHGGPVYRKLQHYQLQSQSTLAFLRLPRRLWLKGLAQEMCIAQGAIRIFFDSHSALSLVQNLVYHARTKHINIKYHRIRELVDDGEMKFVKVYTKDNTADALTKVLSRDSFFGCGVDGTYGSGRAY